MASIYFNGTEIDEVNDDVYFDGTALAIGKSVYFNGVIVWTKQAGCTTFSSGTTYTQLSTSGATSSTGWTTYNTSTVASDVCASSQCTARISAQGGYTTEGDIECYSQLLQNGTQVASSYSNSSGSIVWSSYVTRTISPSDTFVSQLRAGGLTAAVSSSVEIKTGSSGTLFA